jgi:DNA-directed RNA polymerase II subunit RPB3
MLAHRLGLIPVDSGEVDVFQSRHYCGCEGRFCDECSADALLDVECKEERCDVTSRDIEVMDTRLRGFTSKPGNPGILITVLTRGQRLSLKMKVAKGTGREHAKWIPCVPTGWKYEEPREGLDGRTTTHMTLELKGSLDGESTVIAACKILRGKLLDVLRYL